MNIGIPAANANAQNGLGQAAQAPEQQPLAAPQPFQGGVQQGHGLGLQSLGERRLENLPGSLLLGVAAYLQDGHDMVRNINALANLSKRPSLKDAITAIPPGNDVLSRFRLLDGPTRAINRCVSELTAFNVPGPAPYLFGCGPVLAFLSPTKRSQLVQAAIGLDDPRLRGEAIADLAKGRDALSNEDRQSLIDATAHILHSNGPGTPYERIYGTAVAFAGLLEAPNFLEQQQRAEIIGSATALVGMGEHDFNNASISGLGKAIRFLPDVDRRALVATVIEAVNSDERSLALANLGFAVASLADPSISSRAIDAALDLEDGELGALAIGDLTEAMVSMGPGLRQQFVSVALYFFEEPENSEIARKLGAAAEHLSDDERAHLVNLATIPVAVPPHDLAAEADDAEEFAVCSRLFGLAAGMAHLTVSQRDALVSAALSFNGIENKAEAIGAMGQGLQYLHADRREELVNAALSFGDDHNIANLTAIAGLGAGSRHLDNAQRNRLIDAVVSVIDADLDPHPDIVQDTLYAKWMALSVIAASIST